MTAPLEPPMRDPAAARGLLRSRGTVRSLRSARASGSAGSLGSAGSRGSARSRGSVRSLGSAGSRGSARSLGSVRSLGSAGSRGRRPSVGDSGSRGRRPSVGDSGSLAGAVRSLTDAAAWAIAIVLVTFGLWASTDGLSGLFAGGAPAWLSLGRLAGIVAALAALFGLVLTARPRWLERTTGLDGLIAWHRVTGMTAAFAMGLHVVASLVAAGGGVGGVWGALADLVRGTDWFVAALMAALIFAIVSIASWRRVRRTMSYETWHVIHLAGYLAVALGFPHQLFSGSTFASSAAAGWWWTGLYVATAAIVLHSRVGGIVSSVVRPRTSISRVIPEAPGVASLVITGPGVDHLGARPGQFLSLRVLSRDLWWQAHPYSLSAAPRAGALRLTVKALGDASTRTLAVRPGTRVLLEGPYGGLCVERAEGRPVLLIGVGVGLAPMRALLEACAPVHSPVVLARAHSTSDLPLARELDLLARARGGRLIPVLGPRTDFPAGNPFTASALATAVPDLRDRAVFVCGPTALQDRVCRELQRAGVPRGRIHSERFAW